MTRRRKSVEGDAATIRLSQVAPWNSRLGNPYRTRWCQVDDRRFKISTDSLDGVWMVDEVDHDGEPLGHLDKTESDWTWVSEGFSTIAFTLVEAKVKIAEACGLTGSIVRG